jgi:hypothetical protein
MYERSMLERSQQQTLMDIIFEFITELFGEGLLAQKTGKYRVLKTILGIFAFLAVLALFTWIYILIVPQP